MNEKKKKDEEKKKMIACCVGRLKEKVSHMQLVTVPTKQIIAVVGHPFTGKSTLCEHLKKHYGYKIISLKKPVYDALDTLGLQDMFVDSLKNSSSVTDSDETSLLLHATLRDLAEFSELGFKEMFGDDFLLHTAKKKIEKMKATKIVVDDLSCDQDTDFFKRTFDAYIIKVSRPVYEPQSFHKIVKFDHCLENNRTLNDLTKSLDTLFD